MQVKNHKARQLVMDEREHNLGEIVKLLAQGFDLKELNGVAFELGIEPDRIPGDTREEKARELAAYCDRRNRLQVLIDHCRSQRPYLPWPLVVDVDMDE